jgi:hypothetical protein
MATLSTLPAWTGPAIFLATSVEADKQGSTAIMTRNWLLICAAVLCLVGAKPLAADENQPGPKKKELIDTFLQSLRAAESPPNDASDRCPGETPADRSDEEMAPVTSPDDVELAPSEEAAAAELSDEPKTLPDGIRAAPIPEIKRGRSKEPQSTPSVTLTSPMRELRDELRETLGWYYDHPQRVNDRSPWGIMHWLIPFGVDSYVLDANGQRQNTIGYLCYNYPCKGQRLFHLDGNGRLDAAIGPGLQGHRGQFLAMLAQSKVDPNYPMLVGGKAFKVADLIEYEKRTCEAGTELTFKLIALTHYLKHDDKWRNARGEEWDLPRLIREELKQPVVGSACGGTHRMTGFSYAVRRHEARGLLMDGQWERSRKFIDDYHEYVYTLQNRDGSFSTNWFASRGDLVDPQRRLQTTGHILEWLIYSLPEAELQDKRLVHGVKYLTGLLSDGKATHWEIGPLGHALHALALYDERVFGGKPGHRAEELARKPGVTLEK